MKIITPPHKDTVPANAPAHRNQFIPGARPQAVALPPGEACSPAPQGARGAICKGRRRVRRRLSAACAGDVAAISMPEDFVSAVSSPHAATGREPANNLPARDGHTLAPAVPQVCGTLPLSGSIATPAPAWLRALPTASALRLKGSRELRNTRALQRLPLMGRTLVRLLRDIDATLQVVAAFGGTTLHIPAERSARALARHPLRAHLTLQQMRRMVQYFAGTDVYIPRCFQAMVRVRDVSIVQRFDQGIRAGASAASVVRELAREYRLSDRWIWTILKKTEM